MQQLHDYLLSACPTWGLSEPFTFYAHKAVLFYFQPSVLILSWQNKIAMTWPSNRNAWSAKSPCQILGTAQAIFDHRDWVDKNNAFELFWKICLGMRTSCHLGTDQSKNKLGVPIHRDGLYLVPIRLEIETSSSSRFIQQQNADSKFLEHTIHNYVWL